jgi:hypothetical protein
MGGPLAWGLGEGLTILHHKRTACYEKLYRVSDLDGFSGTTQAMENGRNRVVRWIGFI